MKWFRDAKFGMFIHWGLYSQVAGEWKTLATGTGIGALKQVGMSNLKYFKKSAMRFLSCRQSFPLQEHPSPTSLATPLPGRSQGRASVLEESPDTIGQRAL